MSEPNRSTRSNAGLYHLPAPHDRVEFTLSSSGESFSVQYSGSVEDLISAGVVTRQMVTSNKTGRMYERGKYLRRDAAGGEICIRHLKYEVVVIFYEALELGLTLPGVTEFILAAAKAEAIAEDARYEARCAAAGRATAREDEEPDLNSVHRRIGFELGTLSAIADDDATAEDLIALMPELKAKLLARKAKRGTERKRPGFLRLVVTNEARP